MSTSRFVLTNYACAAATVLKNGTGGGAPALDETAPYTMARLLNASRLAFWMTSAAPASPMLVDFDLGASKSISAVGVHGFRPSATAAATTVNVYSGAAYPAATLRATFSLIAGPRDIGAAISTISARYWRFEIYNTAPFSVAKFLLGPLTDLGYAHGPGGDATIYRFRNETPLIGGGVLVDDLGDPGKSFSIPVPTATQTRRAALEALVQQTGSFSYLDPDDELYEVLMSDSARLEVSRAFAAGAASVYSLNLRLTRQP